MIREAKEYTERKVDYMEWPKVLVEEMTMEELNEVEVDKHPMALTLHNHPQALEDYYERLGLGKSIAV